MIFHAKSEEVVSKDYRKGRVPVGPPLPFLPPFSVIFKMTFFQGLKRILRSAKSLTRLEFVYWLEISPLRVFTGYATPRFEISTLYIDTFADA